MTPQMKLFTFALPEDLKAALPEIKVRDGISEVEQIRRGIRLWIERVALSERKAECKRESPRKRPALVCSAGRLRDNSLGCEASAWLTR
jgi:hypothetical protein